MSVLVSRDAQYAAEAERLEKVKVLLLWEAAPVEPRVDHSKVLWRNEFGIVLIEDAARAHAARVAAAISLAVALGL